MDIPQIIFGLGLILIFVKIFGEVFERLSLPPLLGEILLGIVLGTLGIVTIDNSSEVSLGNIIYIFAQIGIICLLFMIGFEQETKKFSEKIKQVIPIEILGMLFPFIGGFFVTYFFGENLFTDPLRGALFVGTALAATSLGVTARTLIDLGYILKPPGIAIITTAIVDAFVGLLFFAIMYGIIEQGNIEIEKIKDTTILLILFLIIVYVFGKFVVKWIAKFLDKMIIKEGTFGILMGILFIFSFLSNEFGMSMIIGAFIFGFSISTVPRVKSDAITNRIKGISSGFFIPFFFVYIGLLFKFDTLMETGIFSILALLFLIVFQIVGAFLGAKFSKFNNQDSLIIGVGMIPRNELMLIIGTMGFTLNLYKADVFSTFVLISIITTLITPLLLMALIKRKGKL